MSSWDTVKIICFYLEGFNTNVCTTVDSEGGHCTMWLFHLTGRTGFTVCLSDFFPFLDYPEIILEMVNLHHIYTSVQLYAYYSGKIEQKIFFPQISFS